MTRIDELKNLYASSLLSEIFKVRKEDDYPAKGYSSLRFKSNPFRIRAIEIWESDENGRYFHIYHSEKIADEIKSAIDGIPGQFRSGRISTDFQGYFKNISKEFCNILSSEIVIEVANKNPVFTRDSAYAGLELPDVDTSDTCILGRFFTWKEVIAINEDVTQENQLKGALSQCGVYLQRSVDGKSRYVGSAYSEGGILARWLKHLTSIGDAKHLNLFVLENGYNNIVFSVLEISQKEEALASESRWKSTLGTKNDEQYDGFRLNNN